MQLLEQIFGSRNNIRVLRYLVNHSDWEFNISELARDLAVNKGILSRLIKKLKENNIIKLNQKGKIVLFKLNKENLIIKSLIIPTFNLEKNFFNEFIMPEISKLKSKDIISIILYGSYAKNTFNLNSDIDLLVIMNNKDKKLEEIIDKLKRRFLEFDLLMRIDIIQIKEFRRLYKIKEPLISSIEQSHLILHGKSFNGLIK